MDGAGVSSWRGGNLGCCIGRFGEDWLHVNAKETQHRGGYCGTGWGDFVLVTECLVGLTSAARVEFALRMALWSHQWSLSEVNHDGEDRLLLIALISEYGMPVHPERQIVVAD